MNISFRLNGTKNIKKLAVRFYHNKLDFSVNTDIIFTDEQWDLAGQNVIDNDELNIHLQELKVSIMKHYNKDYCKGVIINKNWLCSVIKECFMRPKNEEKLQNHDEQIFVSDFAEYWIKNHSAQWRTSNKKFMDESLKKQYSKFIKILIEYESVIGEKLQLRNIKIDDLNSFVEYLETESYQTSTIKRQIGRFRFFLNRALEHNIEVSKSFKQRIYFSDEEDFDGIYLNEQEIDLIIENDLSHDYDLNVAKQNFLIMLFTGLRCSDFMRLDTSNLESGFIKIKTKKTGANIVLPLHKTVKQILNDNFGNLPPKLPMKEFNKSIKTICQLSGITNVVFGKLFDKDAKRKKAGYYEKWKLISSHVARKSMVSNLKGKVSDETIMAIGGWSSVKMMQHYSKVTKTEHAENLSEYWNNN